MSTKKRVDLTIDVSIDLELSEEELKKYNGVFSPLEALALERIEGLGLHTLLLEFGKKLSIENIKDLVVYD